MHGGNEQTKRLEGSRRFGFAFRHRNCLLLGKCRRMPKPGKSQESNAKNAKNTSKEIEEVPKEVEHKVDNEDVEEIDINQVQEDEEDDSEDGDEFDMGDMAEMANYDEDLQVISSALMTEEGESIADIMSDIRDQLVKLVKIGKMLAR